MNKRAVGVIFCVLAVITFVARYVVAAIFLSNLNSGWNANYFNLGLECQGPALLIISIICLALGVAFIVWQEIEDKKKWSENCNLTFRIWKRKRYIPLNFASEDSGILFDHKKIPITDILSGSCSFYKRKEQLKFRLLCQKCISNRFISGGMFRSVSYFES